MNRTTLAAAALAVTAVLGLTACGSSDGGGPGGKNSTAGSNTGGSAQSAATAGATDASGIKAAGTPLGDVLVDHTGRTVYLFTGDSKGVNAMNCDAACLKLWPPVEGRPKAGAGVDAGLISTTTAHGRTQATYAGHPLYYYAQDQGAGDVKGQGIDSIWFVLNASGDAVKKAAGPASSSSGGGYGGGGGPVY